MFVVSFSECKRFYCPIAGKSRIAASSGDLFDKSKVSLHKTICSQHRCEFPPQHHENYQFVFKPA
jgi:hypothetical protein